MITSNRTPLLIGMGVWFAALLLMLLWRQDLADSDRMWWLATPVIGIALGFIGLRLVRGHTGD